MSARNFSIEPQAFDVGRRGFVPICSVFFGFVLICSVFFRFFSDLRSLFSGPHSPISDSFRFAPISSDLFGDLFQGTTSNHNKLLKKKTFLPTFFCNSLEFRARPGYVQTPEIGLL